MSDQPDELRKACEAAAKEFLEGGGGTWIGLADIIERHMRPVFERMRDAVIEECADIAKLDGERICKNEGSMVRIATLPSWVAFDIEQKIRALKGANHDGN